MADRSPTPPLVLVTGASRGLGAALVDRAVARGFPVAACARTEPALPPGATGVTASVEVADATAVEAFCAGASAELGPIGIAVANAGLLEPVGPLRDADPDELARILAVNVGGVAHLAGSFARRVRDRPEPGTFVAVSSGAGRSTYEGWAPYSATKAAVDRLAETLATEEAEAGLRVLSVSPGSVDTDMQALIRATPVERFPSADRFVTLHDDGALISPADAADRLLDLALGTITPAEGADAVAVRLADAS